MTTSGRPASRRVATGALALCLAETAFLWWAISLDAGLAVIISGHALLAAGTAVYVRLAGLHTDRYAMLLLLSLASCGPFGSSGVLLAMALERYHARRATSVDAWHDMLFPAVGGDEQAELWRRVGRRASDRSGDPRVTPFLEVLSFGSVAQRQAVVAIIAQQFRPAFAPALRTALQDEHNVIRVQAATVIARLEQEFLERTLHLEEAARKAAGDPQAMLALATHYDDQAFTGILDAAREEECRVKATECYERYLDQAGDDHVTELRLARLQLRRRLFAQAEPRLQRLADAGHTSASVWLMEALFAQGRYADVRGAAGRYAAVRAEDLPAEAAATVALWAGSEGTA